MVGIRSATVILVLLAVLIGPSPATASDADRAKTQVVYVLRTRTKLPPEYLEIARQGGTEAPQVMN